MAASARWTGVVLDSADPRRLARFWASALGYVVRRDGAGWATVQHPDGGLPLLAFQNADRSGGNRFHLDTTPIVGHHATPEDIEAEVRRLERMGASRIRDVTGESGSLDHVIMSDPEGNVFCVAD